MAYVKRIVAMLVVISMVFVVSACGKKDTSWVVEYNGEKLPAGVYIFHMLRAYEDAFYLVDDPYGDILKQTIDGVASSAWIENETMNRVKELFAIRELFYSLGMEFSQEEVASLDEYIDSMWDSYKDYYEPQGIGRESIRMLIETDDMTYMIFEAYYGENGTTPLPENQLKEHFLENYSKVSYMLFPFIDYWTGETLSEEVMEARRADANSFYARLLAGEDFYELMIDQSELYLEEGEEPFVNDDYYVKRGNYDELPVAFVDNAFETQVGEFATFEDDVFVYIIQRRDLNDDPDIFEEIKLQLIYELKWEEFIAGTAEMGEDIVLEENRDAVKAYTPEVVTENY